MKMSNKRFKLSILKSKGILLREPYKFTTFTPGRCVILRGNAEFSVEFKKLIWSNVIKKNEKKRKEIMFVMYITWWELSVCVKSEHIEPVWTRAPGRQIHLIHIYDNNRCKNPLFHFLRV